MSHKYNNLCIWIKFGILFYFIFFFIHTKQVKALSVSKEQSLLEIQTLEKIHLSNNTCNIENNCKSCNLRNECIWCPGNEENNRCILAEFTSRKEFKKDRIYEADALFGDQCDNPITFIEQCNDEDNELTHCLSKTSCGECLLSLSCAFFKEVTFVNQSIQELDVILSNSNNQIDIFSNEQQILLHNICLPVNVHIIGLGVKNISLHRGDTTYFRTSSSKCYFGTCFFEGFLPWYFLLGGIFIITLILVFIVFIIFILSIIFIIIRSIRAWKKKRNEQLYNAYTNRYTHRSRRFYETIQ